jgi:hypothetical protein
MLKLICLLWGHARPMETVDTMIEMALSNSYQCERCKSVVHIRG